jgi:molybdenum cofactor biosynthesis protein B
MSTASHKKDAPKGIRVAVISVSSTRSLKEDKSGDWIKNQAQKEGTEVLSHQMADDDISDIRNRLVQVMETMVPDAVIITGGTGIGRKDVTIEAVKFLFHKELSAFGPIFAQLSFEEIDSAAILSRATAGIIGKTLVFCLPGSLKACKLACNNLIFPELGHLLKHIKE